MKKVKYYSASEYVTRRAGCLHSNYRIAGGRYIISENDVRAMLPFITAEELVTGLDIIEVSRADADRLIKEGGYKIGPEEPAEEAVAEEPVVEEPAEPAAESGAEETPAVEEEEAETTEKEKEE